MSAKPAIIPMNALLFLLKKEYFSQCDSKKVVKDDKNFIEYSHPDGISFEDWLIRNNIAVPQSVVLGADGKPIQAKA